MQTNLVQIQQEGRDIGYGKLGAVVPAGEEGFEITLNDVHLGEEINFKIAGPFRIRIEDKKFDDCTPTNFRNLRPGCDYDRVIFRTDKKPRLG